MLPLKTPQVAKQSQESKSSSFFALMSFVDVMDGFTKVGHGMVYYRMSDGNRRVELYDNDNEILKEGIYQLITTSEMIPVVMSDKVH